MRQKFNETAKQIITLTLIVFCGCSGTTLRRDYGSVPKNYATASDDQLLYNLARLAHDQPVYFVQLGSMSAQYQFSTSAAFSPSDQRVNPAGMMGSFLQHTLTLGGSLNAGAMETPIFQYLPLTGTNFIQAILTPITDKVFLTFYDQDYPADLVARTMIESVERIIDPKHGTVKNGESYVNHPEYSSYPKFLEFCDNLLNAQICHGLTVDTNGDGTSPIFNSTNVKLADVVSAVQAGMSAECVTNDGHVFVKVTKPDQHLRLVANADTNDYYRALARMLSHQRNETPESLRFTVGQLTNSMNLAILLKNDAIPLFSYIRRRLDLTSGNLTNWLGGRRASYAAEVDLIGRLNRIVDDPAQPFWDARLFQSVRLDHNARELTTKRDLQPLERARLNRLLLEEALPTVLSRRQDPISPTLSAGDLNDLPNLVAQLKANHELFDLLCRGSQAFTASAISNFDKATTGAWKTNYDLDWRHDVQDFVLASLNSLITNADLYTNSGFSGFTNRREMANLTGKSIEPSLRAYRNRFLLEDEFTNRLSSKYRDAMLRFVSTAAFIRDYHDGKYAFKLRTFESVMYGMANEERMFKASIDSTRLPYGNVEFVDNPYGPVARVLLADGRVLADRPVMMLQYDSEFRAHLFKLAEIRYGSDVYTVGDLEKGDTLLDPMSEEIHNETVPGMHNGTAFTILSYLYAQTAISTQNLPVQQLIQVQ